MLLAPFKWIVALFFDWSHALLGDPGWAVVGMSILLSLLLTPLYIWIERRKNSDKVKSAPMQAEIDKIEAVYSGRERYYYTREIQRRYNYSPWTAMIPTLGLLVQIPFLLAAYHYLSELPLFTGAAFLYIKDLSKPDTIATVAGMPINLLAILMTAINLVSGWRYAESGKPKERIQYMAVAAVFLFLLYNCAASVVLYWTLSNALSFARSEMFFRNVHAKRGADSDTRLSVERILSIAWVLIIFCACYCYFTVWFMGDDVLPMRKAVYSFDRCGSFLLLLAWIVLTLLDGILPDRDCCVKTTVCGGYLKSIQRLVSVCAIGAFFLAFLEAFTECPLAGEPVLRYFSERAWPMLGCCSAVALALRLPSVQRVIDVLASMIKMKTPTAWTGLMALSYLVGVVTAWHPLLVYASEPQSFKTSAWEIAFGGIFWIFASGCLYAVLWALFRNKRLRCVMTSLLVWSALMVFFYLFIFPIDVGSLQGAELVGADGMILDVDSYIVDALLLGFLGVAVMYLLSKVQWKFVLAAFMILHVVVIFQGISKCRRAKSMLLSTDSVHGNQYQPNQTVEKKVPDNAKIRLAKKNKNIVVFLLDMVQGHSFENVFNDDALAKSLNGFVWFPNSVSIANMTCPSMPAIYGGSDFSPNRLNADKSRSLNAKARSIMINLRNEFARRGFRFVHYNCNQAVFGNELTRISPLYDREFLSNVTGRPDYFGVSKMLEILRCNALLQSAPLMLRPFIYNDGKWRLSGLEKQRDYQSFSNEHMFYEALPKLTEISEKGDEGFFNFFHVEATHNPWGIPNEDGVIKKTDHVGILKWMISQLNVYFEWMKMNGVYDNTRIVLVSDHGLVNLLKSEFDPSHDPMRNRHIWKKLTDGVPDCRMLQEQKIQMLNCLLAVKDYGCDFPLRRDDRIMSNSDLRTLLESENVAKTVETLPQTRDAFVVQPPEDGSGFQSNTTMDILLHFRINKDVFNLENWERVK